VTIGAIAKALAKAQGEMDHARKDRVNTHFGNHYATLASAIDACRPALNANGIAIVQHVCGESAEMVTVETMLLHESGESISSRYSMPVAKKDPQGHGSAITYARRYALLSIVGLAADDDDGNGASGKDTPAREQQRREPAPRQQQQRDPTEPVVMAGPGKGKAFSAATDAELHAYGEYAMGVIDDPARFAHRDKALAAAKAVDAELQRRGAK
jgi:hypothetical protein